MIHHISYNLKCTSYIPKNIGDDLPLYKFKSYFQKTMYDLDKVLGVDANEILMGLLYMMACDIQDTYHDREYDYVGYILGEMEG